MAEYRFDITDKVIKFACMSIKDMPGNPGQEVLVERLDEDAYGKVEVVLTTTQVTVGRNTIEVPTRIRAEGEIYWRSNHPEAIEQIIDVAEQQVDLITDQAEIPGPWELADAIRTGNWKIVGLDSEWKR